MQHQETNIGNEEGEKEQIQDKSIRNPPTEVEVSSDNTAEEYVILDKETAVSEEEATGEDVLEVTDGGKESTEDALNCKEETNEVSLQETNEIVLEETNEIVLEEPNEISLEEPNEISLEEPNEISLEEPNEISLEKPNEVSLQETNDTVLEETNEVSLEETNDKEKESCPELKTVVSSISQETIQHNCDASSDFSHGFDHHNHHNHNHHNHNHHNSYSESSAIPEEFKHPYLAVFLTTVSALAATLGGAFVVFVYPPSPKILGFMLSFSAGIMLYVIDWKHVTNLA